MTIATRSGGKARALFVELLRNRGVNRCYVFVKITEIQDITLCGILETCLWTAYYINLSSRWPIRTISTAAHATISAVKKAIVCALQ